MSTIRTLALIIAVALAAGPTALWADPGGKDKGQKTPPPGQAAVKGQKGKGGTHSDDALGSLITAGERRLIQDYFGRHAYSTESLPPGIAKNLVRGKPLPPGIAKRHLPQPLLGQLPPRPGYEWLAVGRDIALVVAATGVIVDILREAF